MAKAPFRNDSEKLYADHLSTIGLAYEYEKQWGKYKPDFTIEKRSVPTEVIAIADVKDLRHTPEEEASLAAGHMISIQRDPALRTRRQIYAVWRQFEACISYPCILMLASGGDSLPDPLFVMAAMLGDFTISIPVSMADHSSMEITQSFGENGKMLAKDGSPMNRGISAIGLISSICPDDTYSGFTSKVDELANQFLSEDTDEDAVQKYLAACFNIKAQLIADGYDLECLATQIEYIVNPLAANAFPKTHLAQGYVKVWEFDLQNQTLSMTYDWTQHPKPSLPIT